ncbi:hypothetical protein CASFOL_021121 [Castilleja foliolosa]|uniref:Symplekin n=1 Tax=Castilleja foliolosa TaxID=1961234 RepID=A0ABD3CZS7_9LAMI
MAGASKREQALLLLAAANNHGDLAVKLSSLKQAKDILFSVEPSQAAELFPYLVELQYSPEVLVRKYLIELIDEIGARTREHLFILLPVLLTYLKDNNPVVAKQSIITGTKFFCAVLEELALQFQRRGIVERWLEELWTWMIKFRDAVFSIIFEVGSVGPKLLAIKFLETYVLQFTLDSNDSGTYNSEVTMRPGRMFNISWVTDGHPVLDPPALKSDASRYMGILLDMLHSASNFPGSLTITAVNSLAAIARKKPVYYKSVLNALLDYSPHLETAKGRHTISIQYSLRTAFLGFLRCTHPVILESRDRLVKELRVMNAGDAADQVIRQRDKIMRSNERASLDLQSSKDDQLSGQLHISGDVTKKRSMPLDNDDQNKSFDVASKRFRVGPLNHTTANVNNNDAGHVNGITTKPTGDLTPVEQMIAMIGALIAEGERGVESLEILISNIHADLLADIVITNMKHLPKNPPPLERHNNSSRNHHIDSSSDPSKVVASNGFATSTQIPDLSALVPPSSSNTTSLPFSDMPTSVSFTTDSKRDPRRDPRRLDPRRVVVSVDVPPLTSTVEDNVNSVQQSDFDASHSPTPLVLPPPPYISESTSQLLVSTTQTDVAQLESPVQEVHLSVPRDELHIVEANDILTPDGETNNAFHLSPPPISKVEDAVELASVDVAVLDEAYSSSSQEAGPLSPDISSEILSAELPVLPQYIELTDDHQRNSRRLALERIFSSHIDSQKTDFKQTQTSLVARLFAQCFRNVSFNHLACFFLGKGTTSLGRVAARIDVNDVIGMVQKRIVSDYKQQKGHELVLNILYHLHSLVISDSASSAATVYEKFLLGVTKSLLSDLPASDKSFSRLLGEVPCIPDCVLGLLGDICNKRHCGADARDGDRVTQGLGAVWSLILGRPLCRPACLDIALKCTINLEDDVRAKAIRLVSNKLYAISDISEKIEQYATDMFLSTVDQRLSDSFSPTADPEKRIGGEVEIVETSISGSQVSELGISDNDAVKGVQDSSLKDSSNIFSQAHSLMSLFFALCTKKPTLLQLVFDNYMRASKAVKQAVHRHMAVLMRALGPSCSELLLIISNPPNGSEDLLIQVLQLLCEGQTPPPDLVVTVKHLYETRLKDAAILIPILSAFSKEEVLPIFPQLVQLPLQKFQMALAHILQGSAHTGPALTPAEVLVAIHDISPEKGGLPLKKITDACSACFEQRTVFTQQVLAKALDQMVDRTQIPMLFMRTVIQAIDAFPTMVNRVMEILSKLVNRQVWRMPKLWVGFLKCISQTQPHSFNVLLQLPSPQIENALNKYPSLRGPLTAFVNQSGAKTSLSRSTLVLLGLASEMEMQQTHVDSSSRPSVPNATSA